MHQRIKDLLPVFVAVVVVTLSSLSIVYWAGLKVTSANAYLLRNHEVVEGLEVLLSLVKDAETGQRGFLLTGDEAYLEPYVAAQSRIGEALERLKRWGQAGNVDAETAAGITRLVEERLKVLGQGVQIRRTQGLERAVEYIRAGVGKTTMDQLRLAANQLQTQKRADLAATRERRNVYHVLRTALFGMIAVIQLVFLIWAFRLIRREVEGTERQRQTLATTLASIGDGVIVTDAKSKVSFLNSEAEHLTGWTTEDARGRPLDEVFQIVNEETREIVESPVAKVLRLGTVVGLANHTILIAKDGTERPIDDSGAPIRESENDEILGVVLVFRDFTAHRLAESSLRSALAEKDEALSLLRTLIEHAPVGFTFLDPEMRFRLVNAPLAEINGLPAEAHVGRRLTEVLPELASQAETLFQRALSGQAVLDYPVAGLTANAAGPARHWLESWYPVTSVDGRNLGVGVLVQEVTERKRAEEALRESEERFRTMADGVPFIIWVHDADGQQEFVNLTYCEFFGVTREEMRGGRWQALVHPDDAERYAGEFLACVRERRPLHAETRVRRADGQWRWIESFARPRYSPSGEFLGVVGVSPDITERKEAERALRESEERLRLALAVSPTVIMGQDRDLRYVWIFNPSYGLNPDAVIGRTDAELLSAGTDPLTPLKSRVLKTGVPAREVVELEFAGQWGAFDLAVEPWKDKTGAIIGIMAAATDVTGLRRTEHELRTLNETLETRVYERTVELERSHQALRQAERLAAVGQTMAVISHESRNALQKGLAALEMMSRAQDPAKRQLYADIALKSLRELQQAQEEIREFAAPIHLERSSTALDVLWHEAWEDIAAVREERNAVLQAAGPEMDLLCDVDRYRIKQVFRNLFENTLGACADPVEVKLRWAEENIDGVSAIRVSVRDNGPGVDPEVLPRLLEPFYTTKTKGTGLGLSVVLRTVEAHGGRVEVWSEPGQGFEVSLVLPRSETQA